VSGAEDTSLSPAQPAAADEPAARPGAPPRRRLFHKYAALLIALVGGALLITSAVDFWFSYQENKAALIRVQQEKAQAAAQRIEEFVGEIERQIGWTTHAQWASGPLDQRRQDYFRLLRQVPAITELTELDGEGREQLEVSRLKMDVVASGTDLSQSPAFTGAKADRIWFSPVYFRKQSEPYMTLAIARDGKNAGVTVAEINLKLIWDVVTALKIGEGGYAYVVDGHGKLIADPDISLVLRDTDLSKLPQVAAALTPRPGAPPGVPTGTPPGTPPGAAVGASASVARNLAGNSVLTAHAAIGQLGWLVFVEVPLREAFAPLYGAALRTALLLAFGLIAAALVALRLARRMTGPIQAIAEGAERIGRGDLDRRIDIRTGDEIEALAGQFNRMAGDLQRSYAELDQRVRDRTAELSEALDQQTATAEVLGVINASPGDLAPVFDAMLEKATELCDASIGTLWLFDGEHINPVAMRGAPMGLADFLNRGPHRPNPVQQRQLRGEGTIHLADLKATALYRDGDPLARAVADLGGIQTVLSVPLRREDRVLGLFGVYRQEIRPFSDIQIALIDNFAAQAVIAMENARLITETREALEQQTATAEVLGVINSSPGDLAPVFDAMLEKAMQLCEASFGGLWTFDDGRYVAAALCGVPTAYAEFLAETTLMPGPGSAPYRFLHGERSVLQNIDLADEELYRAGDPQRRALVDLGGARTALQVPLVKDDNVLGVITIYRQEVRPFTDKQFALLQNFAAQAVIAMENARLITETREALEQQTATAEVLGVINSSPGDLAPVFDAIVEKAMHLCDAAFGYMVGIKNGERGHTLATRGIPADYAEFRKRNPVRAGQAGTAARIRAGEPFVHTLDLKDDDLYRRGDPQRRAMVDLGGARTSLIVALRRGPDSVGTINLYRQQVRPFSIKQIALLQNFAAQAVIAMENARLITETREALEQQTATAEVLQVINSSPGDLAPVFDAMLEKALHLCEAAFGLLRGFDGERFPTLAVQGASGAAAERFYETLVADTGSALERIQHGEPVVHVADVMDTEAYRSGVATRQWLVDVTGARTALWVALRKDEALLGVFVIYRKEVRPFTDKQIALLQNFAAQAVIAMENARLITETREALEQQTATAEVLQVINNSPGDLAPVFQVIVEKALRLCGAGFGGMMVYDGELFHRVAVRDDALYSDLYERPIRPEPGTTIERLVRGESVVHIPDLIDDEGYRSGSPLRRELVEAGARSMITIGLRKDRLLLGALHVYRREARPFADKEIALLQNFAAQAVIAMENARLITETREALEQQTATAEVLQVINSSPGDLAPVFDAMLDKAMRLCEASFGFMATYDGERFMPAAQTGVPPALAGYLASGMDLPRPGDAHARLLAGEDLVHMLDSKDEDAYRLGNPLRRAFVDLGGTRTSLVVALRKDSLLLGAFTIYRQEVRPFSDKQIALVQNFAAQAVIAMENARLLTETRERTRDLQESLEYQTAISDVLKVMSGSAFDLAPVLETVVATAVRLCRADQATIYRLEDGEYRWDAAAGQEFTPEFAEIERAARIKPGTGTLVGRVALTRDTVEILDCWNDPLYEVKDDARLGGIRTLLGVPLLRDGVPIGVIGLARRRVEAYSEKEIELVRTFADQAVIAIENARLLNELRERTRDLQESLEYQTATSDVLKVISQSTFDLAPVLQTVLDTAVRLCRAGGSEIFRLGEDGAYRWAVGHAQVPEYATIEQQGAIYRGPGTLVGRTAMAGRAVHVLDALADPLYEQKQGARLGQYRTMLGVPLMREGTVVGVIALSRPVVEAFSEKEIALVTTFADQAVIAIENARLFNELRERTDELARSVEELKALSEVGQAVSSTLDLRGVLSTILNRSVALAGADAGAIFRYRRRDRTFRFVEAVGYTEAMVRDVRALDVGENVTGLGIAIANRGPLQVPDLRERPPNPLRDQAIAAGYRSVLIVPLVGADRVLGATVLQRRAVGEFPEATVRLMQTLAAQSALAIQNARLFNEIADKSEQLAEASRHKSQFLANMSHELRTPLNAILGYTELMADGIYGELAPRAAGVLERVQNNGKHLLALINDVLDLAKIEAGQLSLTLEDYALPDVVQSVVSATEGLATSKGLKFTADIMSGLPTGYGDARRLSQVLLNLVGNAVKFTDAGEVAIAAAAEDGHFVLTVRDTGPGIAPADHGKIFEEFQQVDSSNTRKKGGTGLGLAISKRMVEMQGGTISVDSALGHGATFRVTLPIRVEDTVEELMGAA